MEFGIWNFVILIGVALCVLSPSAVHAQVCSGSPAGVACSCREGSCDPGNIRAQDMFKKKTSVPVFPQTVCAGGGLACFTRSPALCAHAIAALNEPGTSGACRTSCAKPENAATALLSTPEPCPSGQVCCRETNPKAAPATSGAAKELPDPLGGVNIPTFIGNVIRTFASIAGTIALVMFIYGGITLIRSGGDAKLVADGKKIIWNASIGLILIFSAYTFVSAIISAILAE